MNKRINITIEKKKLLLILVIIVCGTYALMLSLRTMPYAEGWYTYYAQLINTGERAYKDFDYLFPPLYLNFISLFTKILGYKIIYLRILGVIFFCLIATFLFLTLSEIFDDNIAVFATIPSMFFLQSEVVQIFYDYIRLMDIFATASLFFLIKFVKAFKAKKTTENHKCIVHKYLFIAGITSSLFILVKQNMGIVFAAYAIILIISIHLVEHSSVKTIIKSGLYYCLGLIIPLAVTILSMTFTGSLKAFLGQTGSDALAAKGGVIAIIFGWFINNAQAFKSGIFSTIVCLVLIVIIHILSSRNTFDNGSIKAISIKYAIAIIFCLVCLISFAAMHLNSDVADTLANNKYINTYNLFLVVISMFLYFVILTIYKSINNDEIFCQELMFITISGAYFAISWGCGMSGGLAEGQASFGLSFLIGLILFKANFRYSEIFKVVVIGICLFITLECSAKKMVNTYNWWGMTDSNYWDSSEKSDDIPILSGLKISESTLSAYEDIYKLVSEKTTENDSIYCFPQIPIFYSLCDRKDPGVRAKVQWFDVASDDSISHDIEVIKENPPKVIIIYETSEYAYSSHETLFRNGEISATRKLKQFLQEYAIGNSYNFYGHIKGEPGNSFLVYYLDNDIQSTTYNAFSGEGTKKNPYQITNAEDLCFLQYSVQHGNDFSNSYFELTNDIDLSNVENWIPIGDDEAETYFYGILNGNGYSISNITCNQNEKDAGLFNNLGGIVVNLGVVNSSFAGKNAATIAVGASESSASIVNCYTKGCTVYGKRAGALADNFIGSVRNSIADTLCYGTEETGLVTNYQGIVSNVYNLNGYIYNGIEDISEERTQFIEDNKSNYLRYLTIKLNTGCTSLKISDTSLNEKVSLKYWESGDTISFIDKIKLSGKGTIKKPYVIQSVSDLSLLRDYVNMGISFNNQYIEQQADINLEGVENFTPIAINEEAPFEGVYNGAGYSISNLNILNENQEAAFFLYNDGTITNLSIKNAMIGGTGVATIVCYGSGKIINCYSDGFLYGFSAGGIAFDFSGKIANCVSVVRMEAIKSCGGITAVSYQNEDNCYSNYANGESKNGQVLSADTIMSLNNYVREKTCINKISLLTWEVMNNIYTLKIQ